MYEISTSLEMLRDANRWGVMREVLQWAREHREQNPTASLSDCIWSGYCEWVK